MKFRALFLFLNLLFSVNIIHAATYYISPQGNNLTGNGTASNPWATLNKAFNFMSGGDTLILMDGVYTGDENSISRATQTPPNGFANSWTIIKAEHNGEAVFDGESKRTMFNVDYIGYGLQNRYWQFEGLIWKNSATSNVSINNSRYIKFLRCGACDANDGNTVNFGTGRNADYILFENCYAWGKGRYQFLIYQSFHCILRQCVGRNDRHNAMNTGSIATFSIYESADTEVQNCIAIDSDQLSAFSNYYALAGGFYVASTSVNNQRTTIKNCLTVNSKIGALWIDGNSSVNASNTVISNSVFLNCSNKTNSSLSLCSLRGYNTLIQNCSFINSSSDFIGLNSYDGIGYHNQTKLRNTIVTNMTTGPALYDIENEDYSCLWNNTVNFDNMVLGAHTKTTIDPIYSDKNIQGGIKYPVRIERGSNLAGTGENNADIGANCLTMIGKNGTLWGESGYNTEQDDMWPFPYQDLIQKKMKAYNGINFSGKRGFCADGTSLTNYIWEYLGYSSPIIIPTPVTPAIPVAPVTPTPPPPTPNITPTIEVTTPTGDHYISPNGNDAAGDGSLTKPWATLNKALSVMTGGETLILLDGVYTGDDNVIARPVRVPPNGQPGAWTIIKAQHDGEVVFDGQNSRTMFDIDYGDYPRIDRYWQFEGIIWKNTIGSNVNINNTRYVKFLRCGGCDAENGNTVNFGTGAGAEYILFENCYAWGSGRYKFLFYKSNHCIVRQCVGRNDRHNAMNTGPIATFAVYESADTEIQNCISVDCDQPQAYSNYYSLSGCFYVPCTRNYTLRTNIRNSVGINSNLGAIWIDGNSTYNSNNTLVSNCSFINCKNANNSLCSLRGYNIVMQNCNFLNCYTNYIGLNSYDGIGYNNQTRLKNSIIYGLKTGTAMNDIEYENYNCLYGNTLNDTDMTLGLNTKTTINPIYSTNNIYAPLKYPVVVERGSLLSGKGESGADIGANCMKMIGKNGTLWGETDYNTEQGNMWRFPNEAIIRAKMKTYSSSGISGNRGFCADGTTLTDYIWSSLGNASPYIGK